MGVFVVYACLSMLYSMFLVLFGVFVTVLHRLLTPVVTVLHLQTPLYAIITYMRLYHIMSTVSVTVTS